MAGFTLNQQPLVWAHPLPDMRSDGTMPDINGTILTSMTFYRPDGEAHAFLCEQSAQTALDAIVQSATVDLRQQLADALESNQWLCEALGERDTCARNAQELIGQLGGAVAALEATLLACEPSVCMARVLKECDARALEKERQRQQEVADQLFDLLVQLDMDSCVLVKALDIAAAKSLDQQGRLARATALCAVRELQMQKLKASREALEQNLKAAKAAKAEAEARLEKGGRECEVSTALYGSPLGSSIAS
jgi:hypothetical protein